MRHFVACLCKSPVNLREAHKMNFILQRSTGTQMMEKMLRASSLHNPDENKICLGLIYKPPCNPNLNISCNKSAYQTELRTKLTQSSQVL
jgi:hypothetical protein